MLGVLHPRDQLRARNGQWLGAADVDGSHPQTLRILLSVPASVLPVAETENKAVHDDPPATTPGRGGQRSNSNA